MTDDSKKEVLRSTTSVEPPNAPMRGYPRRPPPLGRRRPHPRHDNEVARIEMLFALLITGAVAYFVIRRTFF
ncbi:MAG: hypothetical protein KDB80_09775 [Planctomycetes bacterium]|nr:hypothetical protein [Planctomycetota bacterium]